MLCHSGKVENRSGVSECVLNSFNNIIMADKFSTLGRFGDSLWESVVHSDHQEADLWEDLFNNWNRSPSPENVQATEFANPCLLDSQKESFDLESLRQEQPSGTTVVRYVENVRRVGGDILNSGNITKRSFEHKDRIVSGNYKLRSKYDRQFVHGSYQSNKTSIKRAMKNNENAIRHDSAQSLRNKACRGRKGLLDTPSYVSEALGETHSAELCERDIENVHVETSLLGKSGSRVQNNLPALGNGSLHHRSKLKNGSEPTLSKISPIEDDKAGQVQSDSDDSEVDDECWVSGNALINVSTWMIRNQEHLNNALRTVSEGELNDISETSHGEYETFHLREDLQETESKDLTADFDGDILDPYFDDSLHSAASHNCVDTRSRTSASSRTTLAPCAELEAVRNNFFRMRKEYRERRSSMRSSTTCELSQAGSSRGSFRRDSEQQPVKCFMEIVGSDITKRPLENSPSQGIMEGPHRGSEAPSQVQSLSELAIIENMADLLKDIEKSDLVLADHSGWLSHQQSGKDRWCVIADIIMCVFESKDSNKPLLSVLLPGADIYRPSDAKRSNKNEANYGITIDSNIAGQEHTFFAKNSDDYSKWLNSLKLAAEFDQDECDFPEDTNSDHHVSVKNGHGMSPHDSYIFNPLSSAGETDLEIEMSLGSPDSLESPVILSHRNHHRHLDLQNSCSDLSLKSESSTTSKESGISMLDSIDLKKLIQGEMQEHSQLSSLGMSFSTSDMLLSPPKSKSLDRKYFKSMDDLDRLILGKNHLTNPNNNIHNRDPISKNLQMTSEKTLTVSTETVSRRKSQSLRRPMSQSLDLSKITPITSGLVRKASGLKDKMFGRKGKSLQNVTLGSLEEVKISGFLQHKVLLKWQKMFCAISKGCLYAFKTKTDTETPEFVAILSNYTITYLLNDRQKKHKSNRPNVFKLSQPNRKSIYLCAPHNLDLARWIQVIQMEANKVSVDNPDSPHDSFESDSWMTPTLFANTNAKYPLGSMDDLDNCSFSQDGFCPGGEKLSSTCVSEGLEIVSRDQERVTVSHHQSCQNDNDEIISAWDTSSSCSTIYSSTLESSSSVSCDNAPRHDPTVASVWQNDSRYRFSAVRKHAQRIKKTFSDRRSKDNNDKVICKIVIDDMSEDSMQSEDLENLSTEISPEKKKTSDTSNTSPESTLSPTVPKRHKPVSVRQLPVSHLESPDHHGYLERRHQDGSWVKYWFCLKSGWLYAYLTPTDLLTADAIELKQFCTASKVNKFPSKSFVIELSNKRFYSMYLAAENEAEMSKWHEIIERGIAEKGVIPPPHAAPAHSTPREDAINFSSTIMSDDSSVTDEGNSTGDVDVSGNSNSLSEARQHLLDQVMKLKNDLERKQSDTRKKRACIKNSKSVPSQLDKKGEEDQLVHEITSLRQRRLSTQLKVDTLQKHFELHTGTAPKKKPFFRFGGRQKSPTETPSENPFMAEQMKELTSRLEVIDKDLTHRENNRKSLSTKWLDLANNNQELSPEVRRRNGLPLEKPLADSKKRTQSLKLSTSKGLEKVTECATHVVTTHRTESFNSVITPPGDFVDETYSLARLNKGKKWFSRKKNVKETTSSQPTSDLHDNPAPTNQNVCTCDATKSGSDTPKVSPRREINPQVLADIEEFEELSRKALQKVHSSDRGKNNSPTIS